MCRRRFSVSHQTTHRQIFWSALLLLLMVLSCDTALLAQVGGHKLYGDLKVDEGKGGETRPLSYDVILYTRSGNIVARLSVPSRGRYQFLNLADGEYDIVVEVENKEIARLRVAVYSPFKTDFRHDIELEWHDDFGRVGKAATVSADDFYKRSKENQKLFNRAQKDENAKRYDGALASLHQLLGNDPQDFQAWTELGTVYLMQLAYEDAEKSYLKALQVRPTFFLPNLNLGRLYLIQSKFDQAVEALGRAVKINSQSADANYFLGEAYLQVRKGSLAVVYLNTALRLDPQGMVHVHLRLAALYKAAGMKDKAATEYEQFLKKRPDYPDRKKLEKYIAENRKP